MSNQETEEADEDDGNCVEMQVRNALNNHNSNIANNLPQSSPSSLANTFLKKVYKNAKY